MSRSRARARDQAIEQLHDMPLERLFELGDALRGTSPGEHVVVHQLTCKWNRPRGACSCARITLVCGATA